jgi:hypothetical protein
MHFMTKASLLGIGIINLLVFSSHGAEPEAPVTEALVTKDIARNAIAVFRQDPLSPRGRAAGEVVRRFAEKDESVILQINPKVVPFMSNVKILPEDRKLLLDAFVVGNVDSQFLRNEKKDAPYDGVSEIIQVYRLMKNGHAIQSVPEIENFIELEKRGELKKHLASP